MEEETFLRRMTVKPSTITFPVFPLNAEETLHLFESRGIGYNDFFRDFISHPSFSTETIEGEQTVTLITLEDLGLIEPSPFPDIVAAVESHGYSSCPPALGIYLRLFLIDQNQSKNSVLSGQKESPDGAINVLSLKLDDNVEIPRMLYLRNVDGKLWLRAARFDDEFCYPVDTVFAVTSH